MKLVSYSYHKDGRKQFLYVDADRDASMFPPNVREIISSGERHACRKALTPKLNHRELEDFKRNGYLFVAYRIFKGDET